MNKKYGYVFLGLSLILFALFILYNNKELIQEKETTSSSNSIFDNKNYDFIKSRNIKLRTKVSYSVGDKLKLVYSDSDDYHKSYISDDGLKFTAATLGVSTSLDDYFNMRKSILNNEYVSKGYKILSSNIACEYICKSDKILNDDGSIYIDEFSVYKMIDEKEYFGFTYSLENNELSNELINNFIKDIKFTNDASYSVGKIVEDKLEIELVIGERKLAFISLDSKKYSEVIRPLNTYRRTSLKSSNSDDIIGIYIDYKNSNDNIDVHMSKNYNNNIETSGKELKVGNKIFYEYNINTKKYYIFFLDANVFLVIEPSYSTININDFINITIKDV